MNVSKILMGCIVLSSANLSALCLTNNIELSGGYRQDDFKTGENYVGIVAPEDVVRINDTTAKHINVWQIGVKGRLVFPELDCCYNSCGCGFDWGFLRNFYLKGHGYWGTDVGETRFKDSFTLEEEVTG